jgi:CHAD domain-containing protein
VRSGAVPKDENRNRLDQRENMAFAVKRSQSVPSNIKRIVRRETERALADLRAPADDETIHEARKRFKKVRAVLRLVRAELGEKTYGRENTCFRDAGRPLTEMRDAKALLETLDDLPLECARAISARTLTAVRQALEARRDAIRKRKLGEERVLDKVTKAIEGVLERMGDWTFPHKGWSALETGLKGAYKKTRRAFADASADPTTEKLHEWRKQAKYLWHQVQLLEPVRPKVMKKKSEQLHQLSQLLGDDHNLAVLYVTLAGDPVTYGGANALQPLLGLITRRRDELQKEALRLGRRLHRDKSRGFTERIADYWKAWRSKSRAGQTS